MDAHPQLYKRREGHQRENGGECHVEREVGIIAVRALVLDHAITGTIKALAMARTVGKASHSSAVVVSVPNLTHA